MTTLYRLLCVAALALVCEGALIYKPNHKNLTIEDPADLDENTTTAKMDNNTFSTAKTEPRTKDATIPTLKSTRQTTHKIPILKPTRQTTHKIPILKPTRQTTIQVPLKPNRPTTESLPVKRLVTKDINEDNYIIQMSASIYRKEDRIIKMAWDETELPNTYNLYLCTTNSYELNQIMKYHNMPNINIVYPGIKVYYVQMKTNDKYYCRMAVWFEVFRSFRTSNTVTVDLTENAPNSDNSPDIKEASQNRYLIPLIVGLGTLCAVVSIGVFTGYCVYMKKKHLTKSSSPGFQTKASPQPAPSADIPPPSQTASDQPGTIEPDSNHHQTAEPLNNVEPTETPQLNIATAPPTSYSKNTAPQMPYYFLPQAPGAIPPPNGHQPDGNMPYFIPVPMQYYGYPSAGPASQYAYYPPPSAQGFPPHFQAQPTEGTPSTNLSERLQEHHAPIAETAAHPAPEFEEMPTVAPQEENIYPRLVHIKNDDESHS